MNPFKATVQKKQAAEKFLHGAGKRAGQRLDTFLTNSLGKRSVVDNVANPNSALNKRKRNAMPDPSPENDAVRRGIQKAYGPKSKVKRFGTPY